mmetsp:Transcript_7343/g.12953  ORF Transcript_7343/g.12953 Transcript_7343/m.12953 type:complete len:83 (-) Transcript_7343:527-775(-)
MSRPDKVLLFDMKQNAYLTMYNNMTKPLHSALHYNNNSSQMYSRAAEESAVYTKNQQRLVGSECAITATFHKEVYTICFAIR